MQKCLFKLISFCWVLGFSPILFAEQLPPWPKSPRPDFSIERAVEVTDGFRANYLKLEAGDFHLRWVPQGQWVQRESSGRASSLDLYDSRIPGLQMSLILYAATEWLSALDTESVNAYIGSLAQQFPESEVELLNPGAHVPPVGSVPFLGGPFREVHYTVTPIEDGALPFAVYDYMTVKDGYFFVIRFRGSEEILARMERMLVGELFFFDTL